MMKSSSQTMYLSKHLVCKQLWTVMCASKARATTATTDVFVRLLGQLSVWVLWMEFTREWNVVCTATTPYPN